MKTNKFRLLAAMMCCVAMMMTSCKDDLTDRNKLLGKWYCEYAGPGSIVEGDTTLSYNKMVLCGEFMENNKGFCALVLVDKNGDAIIPNVSTYWANCKYSVKSNNVHVTLTANYLPVKQTEWELSYKDKCLSTTYNDKPVTLHPITTEENELYQKWMRQLGFGFMEEDHYNVNDKDITATNWRQQIGLYIYDGVGTDIVDEKGRMGYTAVYLPWYKAGVVNSNLDPNFCDDITPENGWEWVLNLCGNRSYPNNNFFAIYNKYTGILRFFYYMPTVFTSGDDHMWEIDMTDLMAQRCVYSYGLPMDMKIVDKAALNQTKENFFVDYITPYVKNLALDGKITPNAGWWAFDIDMSLYRPDDHTFAIGQSIGLQMRSWNESHVSLTSAITGAMKGTIEMDQTHTYTVSKSKGFFGIIKDVYNVGKAAVGTVAAAKSGNVVGMVSNGVNLAKEGCNLYGDLNPDPDRTVTDTLSNIRGTMSFGFDATAETAGTISTSAPVTGVASPTIPGMQFYTDGTSVGDGVWNIKTSPRVYYFDQLVWDSGDSMDGHEAYSLYFFDPSSIEVALNPNSFPESDIEWAQVNALCGLRDAVKNDGTEKYRKAFGLESASNWTRTSGALCLPYGLPDNYYWGFDFMYKMEDKGGIEYHSKFPIGIGDKLLCGRGIEGEYFIEPSIQKALPQLEVTVIVVVKLKSKEQPIILQRNYLPVFKRMEVHDKKRNSAVYEQIAGASRVHGMVETGPLYDYQLSRIYALLRMIDTEFDFKTVYTQAEGCYDASYILNAYYRNGNYSIWSDDEEESGSWVFEWGYEKPVKIWGYEMTRSDYENYIESLLSYDFPCTWRLRAKEDENDSWHTIASQKDNYDWIGSDYYRWSYTSMFELNKIYKRPYQYFRLEITQKRGPSHKMRLERFNFLF